MSRDKSGKFEKGNPGGPGRPKRPTEIAYMSVVMSKCSIDDWQEICGRAVEDAKNGDAKAREWLGKHLMGAVKAEAPTPMTVQQLALTEIDPVYLERARILSDGAAFNPVDFSTNTVKENEQAAKVLMEEGT